MLLANCNCAAMEQIQSVRRRSSLFSSNQGLEFSTSDNETIKYQQQLRAEVKDWTELLRSKCNDLLQANSAVRTVDQTLLSDEQKRYLADGPSIEKYIKEAKAFVRTMKDYIDQKQFLLEKKAYIAQEIKALVDLELKDRISNDEEQ
ncbi:uncharacterized protein LOC128270563 [Anopheles cruzii]|uniref:uncharacterized protein LOC128270563 n=1 Tax=Anopheles cruzii TaxID=68878 RepID=UPI0022EC76D6|nr:uncharacterized protein LOC128270563 [Anopheles cruzii]